MPDPAGEKLAFPSVLSVTCLSAGILSILMGLLSNHPFALAPGMGLNAVVAFQLVGQLQLTWPQAMSIVFLEGLLILILISYLSEERSGHAGEIIEFACYRVDWD